jgi:small-conductance mechanosensitive channel
MAKRSEREGKTVNEVIREKFSSLPDPLHFELPHAHKKVLEAIYIISMVGAIVLLLILASMAGWLSEVVNASIMLAMVMAAMLVIMLIEKSAITKPPAAAVKAKRGKAKSA